MNEVNTEELARKAAAGLLEITAHATDRMAARRISGADIKQVLATGQAVEKYPADRYGPSCLIFGFTGTGRPLHVVCSYPSRPLVKIITAYEPSPVEWLSDFITRKLPQQ